MPALPGILDYDSKKNLVSFPFLKRLILRFASQHIPKGDNSILRCARVTAYLVNCLAACSKASVVEVADVQPRLDG